MTGVLRLQACYFSDWCEFDDKVSFIDSENVDRLQLRCSVFCSQVIVNVDNMIYLAISSELHIESLLIVHLKNI